MKGFQEDMSERSVNLPAMAKARPPLDLCLSLERL